MNFNLILFVALQVYSSSKPLRIGYYESDGYWLPSASMKRAVMETKQLLEQAGHKVGVQAYGGEKHSKHNRLPNGLKINQRQFYLMRFGS